MKKLFTSIILLTLGVVAMQAADLTVGGKSITSSGDITGLGQSRGTISYDASAKQLTFDGVTINYSGDKLVNWTGTTRLAIRFKGYNKIDVSNYAFYSSQADLRLDGGIDVGAWVDVTTSGQNFAVATVKGGHTLDIRNMVLMAHGVEYCFTGDNSNLSNSKIEFLTCQVTATVSSGTVGAVARFGQATFDSKDAYLTTGAFDTDKHAICDGGTPLNTVKVETGILMGYLPVGIGYSSTRTLTPAGMNGSGTITYDYSNKTLTLDNVNYTTYERFLDNFNQKDLKIVVKGTNTVNCGTTWGIFSRQQFSIEGSSSSYSSNKLTLTNAFGAICLWITANGDAAMTLKNVTLDLTGSSTGISGQRNSEITGDLALNLEKTKIKAVGNSAAIKGFASCTMTDCDVVTPYSCFRSSISGFGQADNNVDKTVEIDVPSTYYDVWVLGHRISNLNTEKFGIDGYTGNLKYYPSEKKLTFNGCKLIAPAGNTADGIKSNNHAVETITLTGDNAVTTKGTAFDLYGDVTIEGSGSLIATSTESSGISMTQYSDNCTLTLNVNNTVKFLGASRGIWGHSGHTSDLVLKKAGDNSDYYFKGTSYGAVYEVSDLKLTDMDFWSGSDGTPGCYFDGGYVRQNGGATVKGDNVVNFYKLGSSDRYGIKVGGVEVTYCNMQGIGSKYITAGGGTAVTYNGSKTLTLNGATIDVGSEDINPIYNISCDNLVVNVTGENTLNTNSGFTSFNIRKNTTIQGSGKLHLTGNRGGIYAYSNSEIRLNDVDIDMDYNLDGDENCKLYVNLTTAGKRISVDGYVTNWNTIYLQNDTQILEPEGAKLSDDYTKVVTAAGGAAKGVVFADKDATGIMGIEMDQNAEVESIFDAQGRQVDELQPGVNIIRMSDGTTRKVIKK
jgi:hypothetical protein